MKAIHLLDRQPAVVRVCICGGPRFSSYRVTFGNISFSEAERWRASDVTHWRSDSTSPQQLLLPIVFLENGAHPLFMDGVLSKPGATMYAGAYLQFESFRLWNAICRDT